MDRKNIGRYEILGELGRGAMGAVLRARDPAMGREVAVKCILTAALAGDQMNEFRERFYREARAAGALSHPGIVPVFDVGEDAGVPFLVMELVQGRTLDAVLKQGQRYTLDRVCEIGQQLAEALGFAHRNGIIHRDIKPANILMTSREVYDTERPRITDFGVAKLVGGDMTTTGQLLGTPAFMPPEQFTGAPIDNRTDLFALGVILYGMATGEQPFSGETLTAVSYKVVHTDPIPPCKLNPALPPQMEAVILKCLAKNPAARYQTGEELAADLAQVRAEALHPGTHAARTMSVMDSGAGETINQVASLRPKDSPSRSAVATAVAGMAAQPAPAESAAAATQSLSPGTPASGTTMLPSPAGATPVAAAAPAAGKKTAKAGPARAGMKRGMLVAAGVVLLAAAGGGAAFLLHSRPKPQPASAPQPPAAAAPAPAPVAANSAPAPAAPPEVKAATQSKVSRAAHKPAAGTKVAAVPVTAAPAPVPGAAAAAAPAPPRPAPAPAPSVAAVSFNPKTLDPGTNTHIKLNLDGFSAPLIVTLQMDGKLYWSGTAGDKKDYQGLLVPPGNHQFRVLVKGQHAVKTSNTVSGDFAAKKHMTLSVKLRPEMPGGSDVLDPSAEVNVNLKKELFPF